MKRTSLTSAAAAFIALWAMSQPAIALDLPTHGAVVLMDLNPAGELDVIPGVLGLPAFPNPVVPALGPPVPPNLPATAAGVFQTGEFLNFWDSVARVYNPWHWETQIVNSNPTPMIFRVIFVSTGPVVTGVLALPPGWGLYMDIAVRDYPPEQGWGFFAAAWGGKPPISVDSSVTENLARDATPPCSFFWEFIEPPGWDPNSVPYVCWPYYPTFKLDRGFDTVGSPSPQNDVLLGSAYPVLDLRVGQGYRRYSPFLPPT